MTPNQKLDDALWRLHVTADSKACWWSIEGPRVWCEMIADHAQSARACLREERSLSARLLILDMRRRTRQVCRRMNIWPSNRTICQLKTADRLVAEVHAVIDAWNATARPNKIRHVVPVERKKAKWE